MRRILLILVITVISAGCATDGRFHKKIFTSTICGGEVSGYSVTYVAYGDAKLLVIPLSKIRVNTEWRFILQPLQLRKSVSTVDYKAQTVTITGKNAADAWINTAGPGAGTGIWVGTGAGGSITGTYDGAANHTLTACVKNLPNTAVGTAIHFNVDVVTVGRLDPRANVY